MHTKTFNFFFILTLCICFTNVLAQPPKVIVSIKPLHSLVSSIMAEVENPSLLLADHQSPHHVQLKPSQKRQLDQADILFYISPELETFLNKPIENNTKLISIALIDTPSLSLLKLRDSELIDTHIWLSPDNAKILVEQITKVLSQKDPDNRLRYKKNAEILQEKLSALDEKLAQKLDAIREKPFLVFHDAFQYFEKRYQLKGLGSVLPDNAHTISAKKLTEVRKKIVEDNIICVFTEAEYSAALVRNVIENTSAKSTILDPLGSNIPAGLDMYFILMENLADRMHECLS